MIGILGTYEDITERRQTEQNRLIAQERTIEAQQDTLREISTPLIPLSDGVVVMPLVGTIDTRRALQIMETLLEGIARLQADVAIIDVSGVRMVDTQVADALLRAARAAKLLGAQVLLTGMSAEIAQTVVHLGADLSGITSVATLRDGLQYAIAQR
jgi:rsbT co-antagonist protein RsbR